MPENVFGRLAETTKGRLLLVNMYLGLADGFNSEISYREVLGFFELVAKQLHAKRITGQAEFFHEVHNAAWNPRAELQLRGTPSGHAGDFLVFRCLSSIKKLLENSGTSPAVKKLAAKWSIDYASFTDDDGQEMADNINSLTAETPLYLSVLVPKQQRIRPDRRCIVWYSRREDWRVKVPCPWDGNVRQRQIASAIRNWLGLGDWPAGTPAFAFCSINGAPQATLKRPTVFDGIDQQWFKYPRDPNLPPSDTWARATDLEKIVMMDGVDLDGGPEAVGESQPISDRFRCYYVGKTDGSIVSPTESYLNRLAAPKDPLLLMRSLHQLLWPNNKCPI